jgi:hypothetical protein
VAYVCGGTENGFSSGCDALKKVIDQAGDNKHSRGKGHTTRVLTQPSVCSLGMVFFFLGARISLALAAGLVGSLQGRWATSLPHHKTE